MVQVIGGLVAGLVIWVIAKGKSGYTATGHMAANGYGAFAVRLLLGAVLITEVLLTFIFCW